MLHLSVNTVHHHYKEQPVNGVYGAGCIYYRNHVPHTAFVKSEVSKC